MTGLKIYQEENEAIAERFGLAVERIRQLPGELTDSTNGRKPDGAFGEFFLWGSEYAIFLLSLLEELENGSYLNLSEQEWKERNRKLYRPMEPEGYGKSFLNPAYGAAAAGPEAGRLLSAVGQELTGLVSSVFRGNHHLLTLTFELFLELYGLAQEKAPWKEWEEAWYYYCHDYQEEFCRDRIRRTFLPEYSVEREIVEEADLSDTRYLYRYGVHVTENEIRIANFLNGLSEEQMEAMAGTFTNGYRKGFEAYRISLEGKSVVQLRYPAGFERMVRAAIRQFSEMGLKPVLRIKSTSPNRQWEFDHRFDQALVLDKPFADAVRAATRKLFEELRTQVRRMAGPAVIESFGEVPFEPEAKPEAPAFSEKQREWSVRLTNELNMLQNEFLPGEETSFTIISYPIPEIGERFEEIFAETVKVNTLDGERYREIQQKLIDALDEGETVHISGAGDNKTDLTVALCLLPDPARQTRFENCIDDVNIPVGEVFTSPKLTGTNGILHVTDVYLQGLRYRNLELEFTDGKITRYCCTNFESEAENRRFLKENLLKNQETLPMGEFAIGTNTTAYVMGRRFAIQGKLPILIAEKTGPHFAVGDTCYSRSEDRAVYNPNGKEIIARDNECSLLRKTDPSKAYFNCHTDITIPYDELDRISVCHTDGSTVDLIRGGRFVLPGTEELNEAFGGPVA